jgi:hypothetical protein
MHAHPAIIQALISERVAELAREAERERAVTRARARERERETIALGDSLRLPDGSWIHLRHDSA